MNMGSDAAGLAHAVGMAAPGEYLGFDLNGTEYGLHMACVQEIRGYEPPSPVAGTPPCLKGVLNLRGVIVPVVDLRLLLGCADAAYLPHTAVITVDVQRHVLGVVVDAVFEVVTLSSAALWPAASAAHLLSATPRIDRRYVTGVGRVAGHTLVLVDVEALLTGADLGLIDHPWG